MPAEAPVRLDVFGLRNCDGTRRALKWLDARGLPYRFFDLRENGLSPDRLRAWLASPRAPELVNRRSTTWRQLGPDDRRGAEVNPLALLQANPTLIKRPVITAGDKVVCVGFSPEALEDWG